MNMKESTRSALRRTRKKTYYCQETILPSFSLFMVWTVGVLRALFVHLQCGCKGQYSCCCTICRVCYTNVSEYVEGHQRCLEKHGVQYVRLYSDITPLLRFPLSWVTHGAWGGCRGVAMVEVSDDVRGIG